MSRALPPGAILLTPADARVLYQIARIGELRSRHRVGDTAAYQLLTDISVCAFSDAAPGNPARQDPASEEREWWTVQQVARQAGLSTRTVRLDCQRQALPSTKQGSTWTITNTAARTYIAARQRT